MFVLSFNWKLTDEPISWRNIAEGTMGGFVNGFMKFTLKTLS